METCLYCDNAADDTCTASYGRPICFDHFLEKSAEIEEELGINEFEDDDDD